MICPNCGREIKDDKLLCEYCGEEVKFVPLFDAELENQIDETISNLIKNLNSSDDKDKNKSQEDSKEDLINDEKEKFYQGIAITVLGIIIVLVLVWFGIKFVLTFNKSNSFSYQYNKAIEFMNDDDYENAIKYFEHALKLEPDEINARFYLGDLYLKTGQYQSGVLALEEMLRMDIPDKQAIYSSLLRALLDKKDYGKLGDVLKTCPYEAIIDIYSEYSAFVPDFGSDEGVYQDKLILELSNINKNGIIYYTLDGSKPTTNSMVYSKPILLESGQYTINAMFVNIYGIASDVVMKSYYISLSMPNDPEVALDTGVYTEPMMVQVFHDKSTKIYYTLDGSTPNENSIRYTEPFEMPYGTSNISFIAINENDLSSNVVQRTYQLDIKAKVSDELAIKVLLNHLICNNTIVDNEGNIKDKTGYNSYFIRTYIEQNDRFYYIIDEYYNNGYGNSTKTNNSYAIDSKDGSAYKAVKTGEGKYNLKEL